MTRINGISVTANFGAPVQFSEEWIDGLYASLEANMAIVSKDLFFDEVGGNITFLFGIACMEGLDPNSLVEGVARDAIDKAIRHANGDEVVVTSALPIIAPGVVTPAEEVFA